MTSRTWNPLADLSDEQREKLDSYALLLRRYNRNVNLISPDTTDSFQTTHAAHCLSIAFRCFPEGSQVVDWGTGGGLPAIPLAIRFPESTFYAVDSVGKKVRAVRSITRRLELDNCFAWHGRAEDWDGTTDYSVSRATAPLSSLWSWHTRVSDTSSDDAFSRADNTWTPGLICLKGGDLSDEVDALRRVDGSLCVEQRRLAPLLDAHGFDDKVLVSVFSSSLAVPSS